jgi:hypothetical protein
LPMMKLFYAPHLAGSDIDATILKNYGVNNPTS